MFRNCHIKKSLFSSYYDSYMIHVHTWAYSSYHVHIWYELCYLLNFFINESTVSSKRDCWAHLKESSKQIWSCFWSRSSSDCFKINYLKQTNTQPITSSWESHLPFPLLPISSLEFNANIYILNNIAGKKLTTKKKKGKTFRGLNSIFQKF